MRPPPLGFVLCGLSDNCCKVIHTTRIEGYQQNWWNRDTSSYQSFSVMERYGFHLNTMQANISAIAVRPFILQEMEIEVCIGYELFLHSNIVLLLILEDVQLFWVLIY